MTANDTKDPLDRCFLRGQSACVGEQVFYRGEFWTIEALLMTLSGCRGYYTHQDGTEITGATVKSPRGVSYDVNIEALYWTAVVEPEAFDAARMASVSVKAVAT